MDLIKKLLVLNPDKRLGRNGFLEIKSHPFFKSSLIKLLLETKFLLFFLVCVNF